MPATEQSSQESAVSSENNNSLNGQIQAQTNTIKSHVTSTHLKFNDNSVKTLAWAFKQQLAILFGMKLDEEKFLTTIMVPINALDVWVLTALRNCNYYSDPNIASNHNAFNGFPAFDHLFNHNPTALGATAAGGIFAVGLYSLMSYIRESRKRRYSDIGLITNTLNLDKLFVAKKDLKRLKKYITRVVEIENEANEQNNDPTKLHNSLIELKAIWADVKNILADPFMSELIQEARPTNIDPRKSIKKSLSLKRWAKQIINNLLNGETSSNDECQGEDIERVQNAFNRASAKQLQTAYEKLMKKNPSICQDKDGNNFQLQFTITGSKIKYALKKQNTVPVEHKQDDKASYLEKKASAVQQWFYDHRKSGLSLSDALYNAVVGGWPMCYWILWMSLKIIGAYSGVPYAGFGVFEILGMAAVVPAFYLAWKGIRYGYHQFKYKYNAKYRAKVDYKNSLTADEKSAIQIAQKKLAQQYGIERQYSRMDATIKHAASKMAQRFKISSDNVEDKHAVALNKILNNERDREDLSASEFSPDTARTNHWQRVQDFKKWLADNQDFLAYLDDTKQISKLSEAKQQELMIWCFWQNTRVEEIKTSSAFQAWTPSNKRPFFKVWTPEDDQSKQYGTWYKDIDPSNTQYLQFSRHYLGSESNVQLDTLAKPSLDELPAFVQRLLYQDSANKRNLMMAGSALYRGITMFMIMSFMMWPWLDAVQTLLPILAAGPIGAAILIASNIVSVAFAVIGFKNSFRNSEKTYYDSLEKINAPENQVLLKRYAANEKLIAEKRKKITELEPQIQEKLSAYNKKAQTLYNQKVKPTEKPGNKPRTYKQFKIRYSAQGINVPRYDDDYSYGAANKPAGPIKTAWTYLKKAFVRLDQFIGTMGSIMFIGRMTLDTVLSILAIISIVVLVAAAPHAALIAFSLGMTIALIGGIGKAILGYHNSQQMQRDLDILNNLDDRVATQTLELEGLDRHLQLLEFQENALESRMQELDAGDVTSVQSKQKSEFCFRWKPFSTENKNAASSTKSEPQELQDVTQAPTEKFAM